MNKESKKEFESKLNILIDKKITQVIYYEINYEKDSWSLNADFDSLDFGFDIILESGDCIGIIWDDDFAKYGVSIKNHSLKQELIHPKMIEVTNISRWKNYKGVEVESFKFVWSWEKEVGLFKRKFYYPQDLIIKFKNDTKVWVSALKVDDDGKCYGMTDQIIVISDENVAKRYELV